MPSRASVQTRDTGDSPSSASPTLAVEQKGEAPAVACGATSVQLLEIL